MSQSVSATQKGVTAAVIVAALGYFVDVYDLILFSILRIPSLRSLGLGDEALLTDGVFILNMQMAGMLVGGVLWGIIGDKKGRISVLFGSIFLYSIANIANGFVETVNGYALWRFLAGVGLAGELGAGITLVSESLPIKTRGYATTIVASVGVLGAVVAALVGDYFDWRTSYFIGGGLGLVLLILRVGVYESGLFTTLQESEVPRGDLRLLFTSGSRIRRYLRCILSGVPVWFVVGILITFSPEFGKALALPELPVAGTSILVCYIGFFVGDLGSGLLSQYLRSRKKVLYLFLVMTAVATWLYVHAHGASLNYFYFICFLLGTSAGFWAVFVTTAAEQFGTNLRATVTTSVPNFVRGAVVPLTWTFQWLKGSFNVLDAGLITGLFTVVIAIVAVAGLRESFSNDLDFIEK